ncbi:MULTISPECIES: ion transporter [unclassified Amycolatopsis]|uniref:ion transporter n=1 Tax=unclassified Amycolatopsis TaxID=2618356 RepID=UPI0028761941|nr:MULTISPECIES: ion transporter [unclassified Amycolatopsis]MDS0133570.1 ion transporter [Amycolatopsis sp. 505]MDS0148585.1 ion transporter [Amycolatopsis sp. CM201R]
MVTSEPELNSGVLPGNVRADDWIMLVLAAGSVGLLGFMVLSPPTRDVGFIIFSIDCGICGIFLLEFLWRWRKRRWARKFLVRNWYELFAMIPVAHPAMAAHKFISVVLLLVRIGRAADRAVGEQFTYRLVDKLSEPIVKAIKKPVTIAVLDEVVKVLETGNYPENLAKSLGAHKDELRSIIAEKIAADPQLGKLKRLPFHDEIVRACVDTSFRVLLEVLLDPRIDDFFSAVVRDNREQIRLAVQLGLNEVDDEDREKALGVRTQRAAAHEYDRLHPGSRP